VAAIGPEDAVLLTMLQSRVAEYWARVDRVDGATDEPCESFFTDDAVMVLGGLRVEGKPALSEFFANRERQEIARKRTTRHIVSNSRLTIETSERAVLRATVAVFAGLGAWPIVTEPPSGVGDFSFEFVKDADGPWRFSAISANSVFAGAAAPAFAQQPTEQ
jgi:SnoaL-like domain